MKIFSLICFSIFTIVVATDCQIQYNERLDDIKAKSIDWVRVHQKKIGDYEYSKRGPYAILKKLQDVDSIYKAKRATTNLSEVVDSADIADYNLRDYKLVEKNIYFISSVKTLRNEYLFGFGKTGSLIKVYKNGFLAN